MITPKTPFDSPALAFRSPSYPAAFCDRVPLRVRLLQTVRPDIPFFCNRDIVARQGQEVEVWVNSHGAVAAILENGELLGLKPGEFEVSAWHEGGLDLEAIEAETEAATPGPWVTVGGLFGFTGYGIEQSEMYGDDGQAIIYANNTGQIAENDAVFIAHARTHIPALIAEARRLRGQVAALQAQVETLRERLQNERFEKE